MTARPYVLKRVEEAREALGGLRRALEALLEEVRANPELARRHAHAIRALITRLDVYAVGLSGALAAIERDAGGVGA